MDFDLKQLYENAGVSLPNENSLGEKIIPDNDPVKLQNFWNWFGGSKVVDEQGRPLVVYHGSKQANIREFQSKYSDSLIFFAYKKEFSENWAKRAIVFDEQRKKLDDFHSSDEYRNIRNQLTNKYIEKHGENFTDNDEIFDQYKKEYHLIDKNFLDKIGIKETVYSVYIKANKIFNTKRDYKIILDDLDKAWKLELDADYTQELKTTLEKYNDVRNKINQWVKTIDRKHLISKDDEEINKQEAELQKELDDAEENYMYWKRKESSRNEALNYIKYGYWMYFERKEIVDRIWELGYDAIELAESTMYNDDGSAPETTTLAVRPGNNQIKSINNKGTFSSASNNIYETVAYHGTPQKFDEFSLKYIGKGEGHHFYGWGLYFAEDINSAYNFNKMRTDGNPDWVLPNGSPVSVLRFDDDDKLIRQGVQFPDEAEAISKYGEKAVDDLIEKYQDYIDRGSDRRSDIACLDFLKSIKGKLISGKGAVYQVEIPDDEYLMLWENRIFGETSRNSKYIQNCLKKMFEEVFPEYTDHLYDMTGADVYQDIAGWIGDKRNMDGKKASQTYNGWQEYTLKTYQLTSMLLLKYGVKGIKYEKDGTNYVIFNPKDVHIQGDARALWS